MTTTALEAAIAALPDELRNAELGETALLERAFRGEIKRPEAWKARQGEIVAAQRFAGEIAAFVAADPAAFLAWTQARQGAPT